MKRVEQKYMEALGLTGGGRIRLGEWPGTQRSKRTGAVTAAPNPLLLLLGNILSIHPLPAYPVAQDSKSQKATSDCPNLNRTTSLRKRGRVWTIQQLYSFSKRDQGLLKEKLDNRITHTHTQMTKACHKCSDFTCVCMCVFKPLNLEIVFYS